MTTVLDGGALTTGLTQRPLPPYPLTSLDPDEVFYQRDPEGPPVYPISIVVVGGGVRPWFLDLVERQLTELVRLRKGWDGGKAERISGEAVMAVVALLAALTTSTSAAPQLFPLPDGGIEIGWRAGGDEIEIEIDPAGSAQVLAVTADEEIVAEGLLDPSQPDAQLVKTRGFLGRLSARVMEARRPG